MGSDAATGGRGPTLRPSRDIIAGIRFGYGLAGGEPRPHDADALLSQLDRPDAIASRFPVAGVEARAGLIADFRAVLRQGREADPGKRNRVNRGRRDMFTGDIEASLLRAIATPEGFRERLVAFWANHFAVRAASPVLRVLAPAMVEEAIRPKVAVRFADMLKAAVVHPAMVYYLDQVASVGPSSPVGRRSGRGINENLARELLELHTLGQPTAYDQADVTRLAKVLTGLGIRKARAAFFRRRAEPGPHAVLGREYRTGAPDLSDVHAVLEDLAQRPETAEHLARRLATHFLGPSPDPTLVGRMAAHYRARGGRLTALYEVMLDAPQAWSGFGSAVKTPQEFVVSTLRAFGLHRDVTGTARSITPRDVHRLFTHPMAAMGQRPFVPPGPDGWADDPAEWITPPRLAARIDWALKAVARFAGAADPRAVLDVALAGAAPEGLRRAVAGAEDRAAGLAMTILAPAFHRR